MRIHVVASLCVFILSLFFNLSAEKYILLFLTIAMVMTAEMINSSIECVVDIFSKNYNSVAKAAKDMAAGAVLITAGFSVIIGMILFSDINSYVRMFNFFVSYPFSVLGLISFKSTPPEVTTSLSGIVDTAVISKFCSLFKILSRVVPFIL